MRNKFYFIINLQGIEIVFCNIIYNIWAIIFQTGPPSVGERVYHILGTENGSENFSRVQEHEI